MMARLLFAAFVGLGAAAHAVSKESVRSELQPERSNLIEGSRKQAKIAMVAESDGAVSRLKLSTVQSPCTNENNTFGWSYGNWNEEFSPPTGVTWEWEDCASKCALASVDVCTFWTLQLEPPNKCFLLTNEGKTIEEEAVGYANIQGLRNPACANANTAAPSAAPVEATVASAAVVEGFWSQCTPTTTDQYVQVESGTCADHCLVVINVEEECDQAGYDVANSGNPANSGVYTGFSPRPNGCVSFYPSSTWVGYYMPSDLEENVSAGQVFSGVSNNPIKYLCRQAPSTVTVQNRKSVFFGPGQCKVSSSTGMQDTPLLYKNVGSHDECMNEAALHPEATGYTVLSSGGSCRIHFGTSDPAGLCDSIVVPGGWTCYDGSTKSGGPINDAYGLTHGDCFRFEV